MRSAAVELIKAEKQAEQIDIKSLEPAMKVKWQLKKLELRKLRNRIKEANVKILHEVE